jgi:uncharacterized protein YggE
MSASTSLPADRLDRSIAVIGTGRASAAPDVMRVQLVVTALRPSVAGALAASEEAVTAIRAVLAGADVAAEDANTVGLSINAEQVWNEQTGPRTTGYRSEHRLAVVLRDLAAAGRILGEALAAGGDDLRLEGVTFEVEEDTELRAQARAAAWADAEARARQLAGLAGARLGPVASIVEQTGSASVPVAPMFAKRDAAMAVEVGVEPGSVGVEVTLAVQWSIA